MGDRITTNEALVSQVKTSSTYAALARLTPSVLECGGGPGQCPTSKRRETWVMVNSSALRTSTNANRPYQPDSDGRETLWQENNRL